MIINKYIILTLILFLSLTCVHTQDYPLYVYSQSYHSEIFNPKLHHVVIVDKKIKVHFVGSNKMFPAGCWSSELIPTACNTKDDEIYIVGREVDIGLGVRVIDYDHVLLGHEFGETLSRIDYRILKPDLVYKIR